MATRRTAARKGKTCADIGCPLANGEDGGACRDCPGPGFFTQHHECDKCRFHGKGDRRCVACLGPADTPSHGGASHVSIDAMPDGGERIMEQRLDTSAAPARIDLSEGESDVAHRVMAFFVALEIDEFALVKHLVAGGNLNTYASINNKPRQYVWKMAKAMMARAPEIRAIVKERKQPNGRVLAPRGASPFQLSLF